MAVGDDELLVFHRRREDVDRAGIADAGEAVEHAELVGDLDVAARRRAEEQALGGLGGVGVEHEYLPEVGAGGAQQVEPVGHGPGERLLVPEDNPLAVVGEFAEGDEAAPLDHGAIARGNGEALGVGEDAGVLFPGEHALGAPLGEVAGGAAVDAVGLAGRVVVEELGQAEDDPDQVVRAALVVGLLHGGRDLVVGLGDDIFKPDPRGIVTERSEGIDTGHAAAALQGAGRVIG
jgi:hypothetical protein